MNHQDNFKNKSSYKRDQGRTDRLNETSDKRDEREPMKKTFSDSHREESNPQPKDDVIVGRNPVMEAIKSGREIEHIFVSSGDKAGSIISILSAAKDRGIIIKECSPQKLNFISESKNHQGVAAILSSATYFDIDEILGQVKNGKGLIIICDEIEDPHNLGAIIRTAEACGADGIIVPKRRSAPIGATCYKASAGACSHVKIAKVANLSNIIDILKKQNFWIYAAEMGSAGWNTVDYTDRNIALIIGGEGNGVSRILKEKCDMLISIPMLGKINSLNASVAAGVLMYEITRQRMAEKQAIDYSKLT